MKTNIEDLGVVGVLVEDWAIDRTYKAKTITTDTQTWIAYISRKPVPAGIELTNTEYWKALFRLDAHQVADYNAFKSTIEAEFGAVTQEFNALKDTVDEFLHSPEGPKIVSEFGNSNVIGISQKTITDAFTRVWDKISDITGEEYAGISMKVTPNYIISNSGATVNIHATPNGSNGSVFEHIEFFVNGTFVYGADNVREVDTDTEISGRSVITCNAKIMGITYSKSVTVEQYSEFFIGFGNSYSAIMTEDYARHLEDIGDLRGNYNLQCNDNDRLFIVMNADMADAFIRADMNGVEIPFGRDFVTVDDVRYLVMTSTNNYNEGLYNIDINS